MLFNIKRFGEEIKHIRKDLNYRQTDIKKLVGVNEDTLRRLEGGVSYPSVQTLDLLSMVYKRDIHQVYKTYCETPIQYIDRIIQEITPSIRNHDYESLKKIADDFRTAFDSTTIKNLTYINDKVEQFHEYLLSLHNIQRSLSDSNRDDIDKLMYVMKIKVEDLDDEKRQIRLDKLEIRIFILLSILYRFKSEYKVGEKLLKLALRELNSNYANDSDYLNFYLLIVSNLMTVYHRQDAFELIDNTYQDSVIVIEDKIGIKNLSAFLIRIGINNYFVKEDNYNEIIRLVLHLLKDAGYEDVAKRYKKNFLKMYPFLDI